MIKLNLGCADRLMDGYINIDKYPNDYPLVRSLILPADVMSLPFGDETVDEVYSSHLLEHLTYNEILEKAMPEWMRVLKPEGTFVVVVPNMGMIAKLWLQEKDINKKIGYWNCAIYGSFRGTEQYHKSSWDPQLLGSLFHTYGLVDIQLTAFEYIFWLKGVGHKPKKVIGVENDPIIQNQNP
jgi:predicted SAM-dependent methyltransferase